ncbi:Rep [uncultured virus]|uniref:ATP-dependent helicase Rep n=1 Tax=uncultured virus TaxID=340016 RepID=A0A2K9LSB3_9VIRU|nr:Rep [uncultured virus]
MAQGKNWCFTLNNPAIDELEVAEALQTREELVYAIYQLEEGENGTPHFQGYVMFSERLRRTQTSALLPKAHWEVAKGTPEQNRVYCSKIPKIGEHVEIGIFPGKGQGRRTDLAGLHSALKDGLRQADYANEYFEFFLRYPNLVQNYDAAQIQPRSAEEETLCWLFIGPPGTGKSRLSRGLADCLYGIDGVFRKFPGKWWDGYRGERAVIWDDFRGHSATFTDFKLCVDRYPLRVEIKGTTCNLAAKHFFITTNSEPDTWWKEEVTGSDHSAIFRRITRVFWQPLPNQFASFPSYAAYAAAVLTPRPFDTPGPPLVEINWNALQEVL